MEVLIRILLRILAGYLLAKGMPPEIGDVVTHPETVLGVETLLAGGVLAISEGWYAMAKRLGWKT